MLLLFVCFQIAKAQSDYPVLTQIVTDNAGLFSANETEELRAKLTAYETKTTHQIVVLTITNLGNDTIENYALQTFNRNGNKLGQDGTDNGILILVAKENRKFRIEVGDGLTPIITDLIASRINRNYITPAFKDEAYFKGIDEATTQLISIIDDPIYAEEFALAEDNKASVSNITKFFSSIFLTGYFFTIGFVVFNQFIVKDKNRKISIKKLFTTYKTKVISLLVLVVGFGIYFNAYFWYAFMASLYLAFISVFVGIGIFVILKMVYKRAISIFTALFTGKLGLIIFPFYLPITLFLLFAGFMFGFMPIILTVIMGSEIIFDTSINTIMSNASPIYVLFFAMGLILLFFIITAAVAIKNIRKSLKHTFGFSFFKREGPLLSGLGGGVSRGRSYSSSGSSSYSSRSSSSFSGGGGGSSGGGSSGSW